MSVVTTSTDRYPGLRPFNIQESHLFFGRKIEINELMNLLISEQVLVLFSKSGVGKSSLLYAGLFPKLHEYNFHPIRIRFQLPPDEIEKSEIKNTPLDIVKSALEKLKGTKTIQYDAKDPGIWEWMKVIELPEGRIPVLVFDQFEEFFTYTADQQRALMVQLCELVHTQPPNRILDWLGDIGMKERNAEQMDWAKQPPVKIIFAIRDDKLPELESIKKYIPLILKNRFRLLPLSRKNAEEAIEEPGKLKQADYKFDTPDFTFDKKLLKEIVDKLAGFSNNNGSEHEVNHNGEGIIDGSQLQKVCGFIEKKIKENGIPKDHKINAKVITEAEIQAIIDNFYSEQLLTLGPAADKAREIIEEHFVIGGVRTFVSHKLMVELTTGYPNLITQMLEARLIKEETIHLGAGYELSHDTLIPSVMKSFEEREKLRMEKEKKEAEDRLQAEIERNQLIERLKDDAVREKQEAESAWQLALEEEKKAKKAEQTANDALDDIIKLSRRNTMIVIISAIVVGALLAWAIIMWGRASNAAAENRALLIDTYNNRAELDYTNNKHHSAFIYYKAAGEQGSDSSRVLLESRLFADISASILMSDERDTTILATYNNASAAVWRTSTTYPRYIFDIKNIGETNISNDGNYISNVKDSTLQVYGVKDGGEIDLTPQLDRSVKIISAAFSPGGNYCLARDVDTNTHVIVLNRKTQNPILDSLQRQKGFLSNKRVQAIRFSKNDRYLYYMDSVRTLYIYDLETNARLKPERRVSSFFVSPTYLYIAILKRNPDSIIIRRMSDNLEKKMKVLPGIDNAGLKELVQNNRNLYLYDNGNVIIFTKTGNPCYQYNYRKNRFADLNELTKSQLFGPIDHGGNMFMLFSRDSSFIFDLNTNKRILYLDSSYIYLPGFMKEKSPDFGDKAVLYDSLTKYKVVNTNDFSKILLHFDPDNDRFVFNQDASCLAWVDKKRNWIFEYNFKTKKYDTVNVNIHNKISLNRYYGKYLSISTNVDDANGGSNELLIDLKTLHKTGKEKIDYLDSVYKDYNDKKPIPGVKKNK